MSLFRTRIRTAIQDEILQAALDKNAEQRLEARRSAYSGLEDDFIALKKEAHALRMEGIKNLDSYLEEFITKAKGNGFFVHYAEDADKARKIIINIAQENDARLISKSKSMMSEEIQLNPALMAAGMDVIETDLGEYIVQLRGEHPSHIITPAVHLRREEVGDTFHQKLGIPRTNNIRELTNTARNLLRNIFLDTDIGITGVNMGIVENGSICIVTNEGNGRMVTTLPKVHIALMGIDRLIPDMDALSLIIKMLPRSATGQKITVYTQIISGPRRSVEIDGAKERHIVLIDNGRNRIRNTPLEEILLCIRCGACINACPIFREIGGFSYTSKHGAYTPYPGPIGSVLSPALFGQEDYGHLAQASTLCGACKEACPMDIDLPTLLLRIRSGEVKTQSLAKEKPRPVGLNIPVTLGLKLFTWLSTKPNLYVFFQRILGRISKFLSPQRSWMRLPAITGWGYSKDFPKPAKTPFRDLFNPPSKPKEQNNNIITAKATDKPSTEVRSSMIRAEDFIISQFKKEFIALNGNLIESKPQQLTAHILALLKKIEISQIMSWGEDQLPGSLVHDIEEQGIQIDFGSNPNIKVGITAADAAISKTGTIVLTSGLGRPSATSLLPDIHIAILHQKDIYPNLSDVLHLQEIVRSSSITLISGPSRTADIEMTLTIGVHGPKELYVVLLNDD